MKRVHLIINPRAGHRAGGRFGAGIAQQLRRLGCQVSVQFTRAPRDAIELAAAACGGSPDCLAVAGGDGTLFEAVNGVLRAGAGELPLGLIPIGTGNDFAKMLGLKPHDWRAACERILSGRPRAVDAGRVNDWHFVNGVGMGFDAQVALAANRLKWLPGMGAYALALLRTLLFDYRNPALHLRHDGGALSLPVTLVTAGNGRCHGGAFRLTPQAEIDDGLLDILVAEAATRRGVLRLAPSVMRGTHLGKPGVRDLRSRRLRVESADPLVVHADGEILYTDAHALEIEILPGALRMLAAGA